VVLGLSLALAVFWAVVTGAVRWVLRVYFHVDTSVYWVDLVFLLSFIFSIIGLSHVQRKDR
jgi:hypothetical protein